MHLLEDNPSERCLSWALIRLVGGDRKSSASARDREYESSFFISKKSQSYSFSEGSGPKSIDESR